MNRSIAILAGVIAVMIVVASCGGGDGSGFTANRGPISPDLIGALGPDVDPGLVPAVQRNFLEGCVKGGAGAIPDLPQVQSDGLLAVCRCSYDSLVSFFEGQASGESADEREADAVARFEAIEEVLAVLGGKLDGQVTELVAACVRTEAGFSAPAS